MQTGVEKQAKRGKKSRIPTGNPESIGDLCCEQVAVAAGEEAAVWAGVAVLAGAVGVGDQVRARKETDGQHSPRSVPCVHSNGIQGVIPLQHIATCSAVRYSVNNQLKSVCPALPRAVAGDIAGLQGGGLICRHGYRYSQDADHALRNPFS